MMNSGKKQNRLAVVIMVLCLAVTIISGSESYYIYSNNIRNISQNKLQVELTGLIENIRYSLHFGKDIDTFFRMNEILTEQIGIQSDVEGLYVVSEDNRVLFATDGRELSDRVLRLSGDNTVSGDQFYAGLPLSEDGKIRLIARSSSKELLFNQSSFLYRFLIESILGFLLVELVMFVLWKKTASKKQPLKKMAVALGVWILLLAFAGGINVYSDHSASIQEIKSLIAESVENDVALVKEMGIKGENLTSPESYLERYYKDIDDVEMVTVDGASDGNVTVSVKPFAPGIILIYLLQALALMAISAITYFLFDRRFDNSSDEKESQKESISYNIEGKTSIKQRLQRTVLIISATALIITSTIGIIIMLAIRSQSEAALITETKTNLVSLVTDKAALAQSRIEEYESVVELFGNYLGDIYAHPGAYSPKRLPATARNDNGEYMCYTIIQNESVDISKYSEMLSLTCNMTDVVYPVLENPDIDIISFYWADEDGLMTIIEKKATSQSPDPVYDYTQSSWYSECRKLRKTIFTDPYNDAFGNGLMITCATPYYDGEGNFIGVLGADILISDIYDEMIRLDMGDGAYAFLVDSAGNVINTDGEVITLSDAENLDQEACDRLLGSDSAVFERENIYYTGAKISSTDWTLGIHAPAGNTLSTVNTIDNEIITAIIIFVIVFALILVAVAAIISRIAAGIADPVIALSEDVSRISGGNLDYKAEVRTNDEIGELAKSFNDMSSSLKEYIADVQNMTAEKERIGTELSVATRIQADMLPRIFPAFPDRTEFDIYASMTPAREVGGDFYDFFLIDDDHLGLVMADVSGKGVPAALFMVIAKTLIKNSALGGAEPADILKSVNRQLCENNDEMLFVTAWVGILTISTGLLKYADAGHEYPALKRREESDFELVISEHYPPLGTMEDNEYVQGELRLKKGDKLFLYTDGVTDARNEEREKYGVSRMLSSISAGSDLSPQDVIERSVDDITAFMGNSEQFDDITMLCLDFM